MTDTVDLEAENALDNRICALEREQLGRRLYRLQAVAAARQVRRAVQEGVIPGVMDSPD